MKFAKLVKKSNSMLLYFLLGTYSQTIILYHSPPKSLHCNEGERGGAALQTDNLKSGGQQITASHRSDGT